MRMYFRIHEQTYFDLWNLFINNQFLEIKYLPMCIMPNQLDSSLIRTNLHLR